MLETIDRHERKMRLAMMFRGQINRALFIIFMPVLCWAQQLCSESGQGDEYALLTKHKFSDVTISIEFKSDSQPANFFILFTPSVNIPTTEFYYIQFGSDTWGTRIYYTKGDVNQEVSYSPESLINTSGWTTAVITISDSIIADAVRTPVSFAEGCIGFGAYRNPACFRNLLIQGKSGGQDVIYTGFTNDFSFFDQELWDTSGIPIDTLYTDTVTVTWNPNSEKDLAGYHLRWGVGRGKVILPDDTLTQVGIDSAGIYLFELAAFDTASN
ncbi:MAG: hypothetical protein ACE5EH_13170, partial [Gammaproteobacteria bacterium]